jgi:hypothetical protein
VDDRQLVWRAAIQEPTACGLVQCPLFRDCSNVTGLFLSLARRGCGEPRGGPARWVQVGFPAASGSIPSPIAWTVLNRPVTLLQSQKSEQQYISDLDKAREKLLNAFDNKYNEVKKNKRIKISEQVDSLNAIQSERDGFQKKGILPNQPGMKAAKSDYLSAVDKARSKCWHAYEKAATDYRNKNVLEKADSTLEAGKRLLQPEMFLRDMQYLSLNVPFPHYFRDNGRLGSVDRPINVRGQGSPHGIYLHPPRHSFSEVIYNINGEWSGFQGSVAINPRPEGGDYPGGPITFEVSGDGQVLWKSTPIAKFDEPEQFRIKVTRIDRLRLRVYCPESENTAWAVWLEPRLMR